MSDNKLRKLFFIGALALGSSPLHATGGDTAALIKEADVLYAERLSAGNAEAAYQKYQTIFEKDPKSVEACWKAARAAWWVADQAVKRSDKLKIFQEGVDWSKKGLALDPNSIDSHFWLGGNYGSYGEAKGVLKSLALVKPIRHEMEAILQINPAYDDGGAYRVLGIVDYKVPGFAGGDRKRALERLTNAYEMNPRNPFANYYLAEYFSVVKNYEKTSEYLAALDALTPADADKADLFLMQEKGKTLRTSLKKKLKA